MNFNAVRRMAVSATLLLLVAAAPAAVTQPDKPLAPANRKTAAAGAPGKPSSAARVVDINSASQAELMKLPGVSAADAQRIIARRPYLSKAHLVTRNAIPAGLYHNIKALIVAKQKGVPPPAATRGK